MTKCVVLLFLFLFPLIADCQRVDFFTTAKGEKIFFRDYGSPDMKPVLILSGGPGNDCQQVQDIAFAFKDDFRCILLEQRGTGLSKLKDISQSSFKLDDYINDTHLLLAKLKIDNIILIGHSWGATLAMSYAAKYPMIVSKLILIGPGSYRSDTSIKETFADNKLARLNADDAVRFKRLEFINTHRNLTPVEAHEYTYIKYLPYVFDKSNYDTLLQQIEKGKPDTVIQRLVSQNLRLINFDLREKISNFDIPIFCICGRQDPLAFITYEIKIMQPKTKIYWISKCGHFPMYEQPEIFFCTLKNALEF